MIRVDEARNSLLIVSFLLYQREMVLSEASEELTVQLNPLEITTVGT
jgi:hypothetical protein